jgi:hypothetical protein
MGLLVRALVLMAVTLAALAARGQATAAVPKNADECRRIASALEKRTDALHRRTRQVVPRELSRVAADLDDFCNEGTFDKAAVSIAWIENCLAHFTADYAKGFCTRKRAYFCAVYTDSEGCRSP